MFEFSNFFESIKEDSRIGPIHISLYMAILQHRNENGYGARVFAFSKDLMKRAKISGVATYHRTIRQLHEYGYIQYEPSYNHFAKSLFCLSPNTRAKR